MTPDQIEAAVLAALEIERPFTSAGAAEYAKAAGSGNPMSLRMLVEQTWARARIANPPMANPGPVEVALDQLQSTVDALAEQVTNLAAAVASRH